MWDIKRLLSLLPLTVADALQNTSPEIRNGMTELRLRAGKPLAVTVGKKTVFLSAAGAASSVENGLIVPCKTVQEALLSLCGHSLHGIEKTLEQGYFTATGGFRVGVCMKPDGGRQGEALSLCIRLPREVIGAAKEIYPIWKKSSGFILAGPPASGKTTVLRDLCRMVSTGFDDAPCRTVLIDERNELSGWNGNETAFQLGPCTDILSGIPKEQAIHRAIRTLSPEVILCDEIADEKEAKAIRDGFYCGVKFAVTMHCGSRKEMSDNVILNELMGTGAFSHICLLGVPAGGKALVVTKDEFFCKADRVDNHFRDLRCDWNDHFGQAIPKPPAVGVDGTILGGFFAGDGFISGFTEGNYKDACGSLDVSGVSLCPKSGGISGDILHFTEEGTHRERSSADNAKNHSAVSGYLGQCANGSRTPDAVKCFDSTEAGGKILGGTKDPSRGALQETGHTGRACTCGSAHLMEETAWKWISSSE